MTRARARRLSALIESGRSTARWTVDRVGEMSRVMLAAGGTAMLGTAGR